MQAVHAKVYEVDEAVMIALEPTAPEKDVSDGHDVVAVVTHVKEYVVCVAVAVDAPLVTQKPLKAEFTVEPEIWMVTGAAALTEGPRTDVTTVMTLLPLVDEIVEMPKVDELTDEALVVVHTPL